MDDQSVLLLAVCHIDSRAATWYMRLEINGNSPQNMEELGRLILKEFVPSIEKSSENMSLMALKWIVGMSWINIFESLRN